ncbi:hypothetical protein TNCV_2182371 [Trichonephila clavipes]|uniref:Uncharacterized protein n=1 Tax=Trichonephila clavipes TaxID=2585209 RepID=A0A8X6VV41_TRICX|nr:hypothetical protein TNCV_2182371 [Trichonephila clavipes]
MVSLDHPSSPSTDFGRLDDEEASPGVRSLQAFYLFLYDQLTDVFLEVSDYDRHVMSSSPVPLKTRRVGQRCTVNLSRAQTSSRWCGVVVKRRGASPDIVLVT